LLVTQSLGWETPSGIISNAFLEVRAEGVHDQMFCPPGDVGGPLVYQGQIAGVASFRDSRTCYDIKPGYYVGLTRFGDWIRTTMLELEGDPPTLSLPANITVDATSPSGAVVTYSASATDPGGPVPFTCDPPSGNTFAIGVTVASCTTTNEAGTTNGAFQVLVQAAAAQVSNLTATVQSFNLVQGIANSLDAKLLNVVSALSAARAGSSVSTCNQLAAFNNQTVAQSGKQLTVDQANQLMTSANRIKAVIGCP
jgi:hypothetical protein